MNERSNRWDLVASALLRRYDELAITQADVVRRSGVSDLTVRRLEKGRITDQGPKDVTLGKIEKAVQWERGSIRRILAGGEPVPTTPAATGEASDAAALVLRLEAENASLRARLSALAAELDRLAPPTRPKRRPAER